jgi:hypothetical protein
MLSGILPAIGSECWTGSSVTGAKLPAIWTLGSAVLGSGCWRSCETKADSTASKAMAAAFCKMFHCWGTGLLAVEEEEEEEVGLSFGGTILVEG